MMKWHWNHKKKTLHISSHRMCLVTKWWDTATLQIGDNPHTLLQNWIWCCDWPRFKKINIHALPCKRSERKHSRHSITFLCLPLNTTAKAPCPTRSFLLYSKSPTVSIAMGWWSRTDGRLQNVALSLRNVAICPLSLGDAAPCAADLFHDRLICVLLHKKGMLFRHGALTCPLLDGMCAKSHRTDGSEPW